MTSSGCGMDSFCPTDLSWPHSDQFTLHPIMNSVFTFTLVSDIRRLTMLPDWMTCCRFAPKGVPLLNGTCFRQGLFGEEAGSLLLRSRKERLREHVDSIPLALACQSRKIGARREWTLTNGRPTTADSTLLNSRRGTLIEPKTKIVELLDVG
jgi:hypothetical protein